MRTSATASSETLRIRRYGPHRRAAELGFSTLRLGTTVQQPAAQRLYLKNGYREAGRGSVGPFDCIFYDRKILG
jgi:hypothetical protein